MMVPAMMMPAMFFVDDHHFDGVRLSQWNKKAQAKCHQQKADQFFHKNYDFYIRQK
jgi:hypothetical protein